MKFVLLRRFDQKEIENDQIFDCKNLEKVFQEITQIELKSFESIDNFFEIMKKWKIISNDFYYKICLNFFMEKHSIIRLFNCLNTPPENIYVYSE